MAQVAAISARINAVLTSEAGSQRNARTTTVEPSKNARHPCERGDVRLHVGNSLDRNAGRMNRVIVHRAREKRSSRNRGHVNASEIVVGVVHEKSTTT